MKRLTLAVLTIALCLPTFGQEVLTNKSVVELHEAGLPASVIIAKINSTQSTFDTTVDSLVELAGAGVPSEVITAMTSAGAPTQPAQVQAQHSGRLITGQLATPQANVQTVFTDPHCPGPGIYYAEDGEKVRAIEPSAYSGAKTAGAFLSRVSYGAVSVKSKAMLNGMRSGNRIEDRSPTFYFCFEESQTGLSYETTGATTPSQFLLVTLEPRLKQSARMLVTGKINAWNGGYAGPPPKYRRQFTSDKIGPGMYRVSANGLVPGEYAFFYTGSPTATTATTYGLSAVGGGKVFDFSVL